jgi:hypothetical protein
MRSHARHRAWVALLVVSFAMVACRSATDGSAPPDAPVSRAPTQSESVALVRLRPGDLPFLQNSGLRDSLRTVIRDRAAFAELWARMYASYGERPAVPDVDCEREMIVVAALGTRGTGGFGIYLDSASIAGNTLLVHVRRVEPGPNCGTTQALTEPVDLARVPRDARPVRFVEHSAVHQCE